MSRRDDYSSDVTLTTITDREAETILTRQSRDESAPDALVTLIEELERRFALERPVPAGLATEAARLARESRPTLAVVPRSTPQWRRWAVAASIAVFSVASAGGVALAADGSVPGDALYGIDRALEQVGIGRGDSAERLAEAEVLTSRGELAAALELTAEALTDEGSELEEARNALTEAANEISDTPATAELQTSLGELIALIEANVGEGRGADGRAFGQAVAEAAQGVTTGPAGPNSTAPEGTPGTTPGSTAPGGSNQPEDGSADGPGGGNAGRPEDPGSSGNQDNPASPPSTPGQANQGTSSEADSGNGSSGGSAPADEGDDGDGGSNGGSGGNGKPDESPSDTAPGKAKKP